MHGQGQTYKALFVSKTAILSEAILTELLSITYWCWQIQESQSVVVYASTSEKKVLKVEKILQTLKNASSPWLNTWMFFFLCETPAFWRWKRISANKRKPSDLYWMCTTHGCTPRFVALKLNKTGAHQNSELGTLSENHSKTYQHFQRLWRLKKKKMHYDSQQTSY